MAERLHPGVYIEEVSSGVRPIEGVSTSTAAFVGEAARGIPGRAQFITSFDDFIRAYGGHVPGDKGLLAQAVEAFFANGGRRAYAIRVLPADATTGGSMAVAATSGIALPERPTALHFVAKGDGVWADALRVDIDAATHFPGEAFRIRIGWSENGVTRVLEVHDDVRMDPTSEDYVVDLLSRGSRYVEAVDDFALGVGATTPAVLPVPEQAPVIAMGGSNAITVYKDAELLVQWWIGDAPTSAPTKVTFTQTAVNTAVGANTPFDAQGKVSLTAADLQALLAAELGSAFVATLGVSDITTVEIRPAVSVVPYLFIPISDLRTLAVELSWNVGGAPGVPLDIGEQTAVPTDAVVFTTVKALIDAAPTLTGKVAVSLVGTTIAIRGINGQDVRSLAVTPVGTSYSSPSLQGTTVDSLDAVHLSVTENRKPGAPSLLKSLGLGAGARARGYKENSPANPKARPTATTALKLTGGSDGTGSPGLAQFSGNPVTKTGLYALDGKEVNLVAIPGRNTPEFITAGISYCDARGECFFLADGPGLAHGALDMTAADAKQFIESLPQRSKNAAIYFPWVQISDPVGVGRNPTRFAPPSGFVAGIYARTDNTRGVWKAPAGIEASVSGALGIQLDVPDADQDILNPVNLNCLRQFPAAGIVAWGARTLSSDPEWRYVPVRRMALFLKESLRRGMQWAVFEPNDEDLWDQIRLNMTAFMLGLFRQGAFQGTTPQEAFLVKCDRSTNPQENVDAGIVTAKVAFAPLKPAEFVVIEISQKSLVG